MEAEMVQVQSVVVESIEMGAVNAWLRTATGWQLAVAWYPADSETECGWEVSEGVAADGCHRLGWVCDAQVGEVLVAESGWRPSKRDHVAAMDAQAQLDVVTARVRLESRHGTVRR